MRYTSYEAGNSTASPTGWRGLLSTAIVFLVLGANASIRRVLLERGGEGCFWMLFAMTVVNPSPLLPEKFWGFLCPIYVLSWAMCTFALTIFGDPMMLFESGWRWMTESYSLFTIAVFFSALLHISLTFILNMWPITVQNLPQLQRFKIQKSKKPATAEQWYHVFLHIFASQLLVQLPLITGQYYFMKYFNIPYSYETMPGFWSIAWKLVASLIIEDTWVYIGHRSLHHPRIYKYVHKVHHIYQAPFAPDAEYEHPVETVVLGIGFFLAAMTFTDHLMFLWSWLYVRLLATYDSHTGYDLPFSLFRWLPGYNGAREHDWHHEFFNGNYAPTFVWWDRIFGTNKSFEKHERQRRLKQAQEVGEAMETRGDAWYKEHGYQLKAKAGEVDLNPAKVPFSTCLVTGSEGMVGQCMVQQLCERGAKRVVCLDIVPGPTDRFRAVAEEFKAKYGTELVYRRGNIAELSELTGDDSPFEGVEVVFHLAAIVGPYYKHEIFAQVNDLGARNVLNAFLKHGKSSGPHIVLVDCSSPSTRYPLEGDINGPMEHELVYQTRIHEYATTKARGEKALLDANGTKGEKGNVLATCAVAPHQVYAPQDQLFLPAMIETAQSGKLRLFGDGENVVSFCHAENISHGLIVGGAKLYEEGSKSKAAGEFFVVTDGTAVSFWDAVNDAVVELGYPSIYERVRYPMPLLTVVAWIGVLFTKITGKFIKLTPFTLRMLVINRTFCTAKARHVLGYRPVISFKDGWKATVAAAKERFRPDLKKED